MPDCHLCNHAFAPSNVTVHGKPWCGYGESVKVTLPLPHRALSPNARVHWREKATATKAYRALASTSGREQIIGQANAGRHEWRWKSATAQATFFHTQNRRRDRDNLLASLKAAFDGIADAGIVADDSGITHLPVQCKIDKDSPRVEITITRLAEE